MERHDPRRATRQDIKLFLDRSTNSKRFADAVRRLAGDVVTIGERYGVRPAENVLDEQWLGEATAEGRICVGADKAILSNELELAAILEHSARYLVFSSNNLTSREQIARFEGALDGILRLAELPGPWVHKLTADGLLEVTADTLRERLARRRKRG